MEPENIEEKELKCYELAVNFVPQLSEENLAAEYGNLKDGLTAVAASVVAEQYPRLIDLAYEMDRVIANKRQRFKKAYFGWIKFEATAEGLDQFKEKIKRNENIIRQLFIKTVKENTLAPKKSFVQGYRKKTADREEEAAPIDKEAVDKKIEELVV